MSKLLNDYIRFYNDLAKEYNKKNKNTPLELLTDESGQAFFDKITRLCRVDTVYDHRELHFRLLNVIHDIIAIAKKLKFKDKMLKATILDLEWLEMFEKDNPDLFTEDALNNHRYNELLEHPVFAKASINKYLDMLMGKTVDYLPRTLSNTDQLNQLVELFDSLKVRLNLLVDNELCYWVYPFTENFQYMPFELRHFNNLNSLGDSITKWVDESHDTVAVNFLNSKGYNVFSGWGSLAQFVDISDKISLKPEARKQIVLYNPSKHELDKIIHGAYERSYIYIVNENFDMVSPQNRALLYRTVATCIYRFSKGSTIPAKVLTHIYNSVARLCANTPALRARKDRGLWFLPEDVNVLVDILKLFSKSIANEIASVVATHAFDMVTPNADADMRAIHTHHHAFLARTYNLTFHARNTFTDEDIKEALAVYQEVLMRSYFNFVTKDEDKWLFKASLEMWLNIDDKQRVNTAYDEIVEWFSVRHTKEVNEEFFDNNFYYFLYLSYKNKAALLERLENEPFGFVNYGGSMDVYDRIVNLIKHDLEHPIMENRIVEIDVGKDGLSVAR